MKRSLLIPLFLSIICLSTSDAQLLTDIADTIRTEGVGTDLYIVIGYSGRVVFGYQDMRKSIRNKALLSWSSEVYQCGCRFVIRESFFPESGSGSTLQKQ